MKNASPLFKISLPALAVPGMQCLKELDEIRLRVLEGVGAEITFIERYIWASLKTSVFRDAHILLEECQMGAGKNVYNNLGAIIKYCNDNPNELEKLLNADYSNRMFGIAFPFFIDVNDIDEENPRTQSRRFLKRKEFFVGNRTVRVTSQWTYAHIQRFKEYLENKNIQPIVPISGNIGRNNGGSKNKRRNNTGRYKGRAIGYAQNQLVRNILSNLGDESFSEDDWEKTIEYFGNRCAYCGTDNTLEMEHLIPINKEKMGEHKIGNLVPVCKKCNSDKGGKDYKEFLNGNTDAIKRIEEYMKSRNYTPLGGNEQIRKVLEMAYAEVGPIAERYIMLINEVLLQNPHSENTMR
jgi:hypothetical protein